MKHQIYDKTEDMSKAAAQIIAKLINENNAFKNPDGTIGKPTVLGLATGNTPIGVYDELARMHERHEVDFSRVITFNLDEYWGKDWEDKPIDENHDESFRKYMNDKLFNRVGITPDRVNFLDGTIGINETDEAVREKLIDDHCKAYQAKIREVGGIDLQLIGIGQNGHFAFNEPKFNALTLPDGDTTFSRSSGTRKVRLTASTQNANPKRPSNEALTMGMNDIMKCRRVLQIASGDAKAEAIYGALLAPYNPELWPSSVLRFHDDYTIMMAEGAQSKVVEKLSQEPDTKIESAALESYLARRRTPTVPSQTAR